MNEEAKLYIEKLITRTVIRGFPEHIYRYYAFDKEEHFFDSIKSGYLYFSSPLDFNDPFDFNNGLIINTHKENTASMKEFLKRNKVNKDVIKSITSKNKHKSIEILKTMTNGSINKIGVCCFSRNYDSILLWSHYADKHSGCCVKFKTQSDPGTFKKIIDVNYTDTFEYISYIKNEQKALAHLAYTKFIDWEYENEMRLIKTNEKGKCYFNKEAVEAVYFGVNATPRNILSTKSVFKESGYSPSVKFFQVKLKTNDFKMVFDEI